MQNNKKIIFKYPAIFEPAIEGGYNVSFPSSPGCVTFGKNLREAKTKAKEVLELWLEELLEQGKNIPKNKFQPIISEVKINISAKKNNYEAVNS